jgi:outer membrane receptor protein involved in Fe transport
MRGLLVLVLLLGAGTMCVLDVAAQSTGRIAGRVTDAATGEPLPGVNVVIEGTTTGASTDLDGNYFIAHLRPGTYAIKASMIGYRDAIFQDIRVQGNATARVDIRLQESVIEGEEVIITAQRPPVDRNVTTSMVVIESRELEARPTSSFSDVLLQLPGIDMEDGQMRIRGGTLDEVAVMVDGTRARNPLDHSPFLRFNLGAIQEVEVITGTFNAEYGEAQSGVINVIMKEGGDRYEGYADFRFTPPGLRHFGVSLYDQNTPLYWENSNARHLQWWIEYPDMWRDPNGVRGSDPRSVWTPEQAYQNYMDTHQPLNRYWETPTYETEFGLGGRVPGISRLYFFGSGKFREEAPVMGNAYRDRGRFYDGSMKLTYRMTPQSRLQLSGFAGKEQTSWGVGWLDYWWATNFGIDARYAYFDLFGLPESSTNGVTLQYTNVLNTRTMMELRASRVHAFRSMSPFPDDPIGWEAEGPTRSLIFALDREGREVPGAYQTMVGFNTTGYFNRFEGSNEEYYVAGYLSSQLNMNVNVKSGFDFSYYLIDHFNQAKLPNRTDDRTYRPYQGSGYAQSRVEYGGLVMNLGMRLDLYNPNDVVYLDPFDPLNAETRRTRTFMQLSPRLGVSHPIDERTKLHFSYGHFFQRAPFADYGEGNSPGDVRGVLTTYIIDDTDQPWVLGNRDLRPMRTTAFEVGLERNFWDAWLVTATGYYKDIRNTIRMITVLDPSRGINYQTNGNGNYAANRGFELSLRKLPRNYSWGSLWGHVNYSDRASIWGRSGDPETIQPDRDIFSDSGEYFTPNRPRMRAGLYFVTPRLPGFASAVSDVIFSFDYSRVWPHRDIPSDRVDLEDGTVELRPPDQMLNMRARKEFTAGRTRFAPYVEVANLPNWRWVNLDAFRNTSQDDQRRMLESSFSELPTHTTNGSPILDVAKYRNLRRSVVFGFQFNF